MAKEGVTHVKKASLLALRGLLLLLVALPMVSSGASSSPSLLRVVRFVPAPGSAAVSPDGIVTVYFDRPVVSLARLGSGPAAATVSPPIPGQQRWLGTSTWTILPAHGLAPATTYSLQLNPTLHAIDGSALAGSGPVQFTTLRPAVESITPTNGLQGVLPRAPVVVSFNVPVVHASAQAHFSLKLGQSAGPLPGSFSWRSDGAMQFTPASPLPRGQRLIVGESPGVAALGGPLPGTADFFGHFDVAPAFALARSTPSDGASNVDPFSSLQLHFTAPVDLRVAGRYLRIAPPIAALHLDVGDDQNSLAVYGNLRPSTAYRISVLPGFPDLLGDHLAAGRTVSFQTAAYQPSLNIYGIGVLNTYDAYRGVHLYGSAVNVSSVSLSVYRQSEREFLRSTTPGFNTQNYTPPGAALATYTLPMRAALNHNAPVAQLVRGAGGGALAPGYYGVIARAPGVSNGQYLPVLVTRSSLTFKVGDDSVLLWANDLKGGTPLAYLPVRVVDGKDNTVLSGRTDAHGVFSGRVAPSRHLSNDTLYAFVGRPNDTAACGTSWNNGISPGDYSLPQDSTLTRTRIYLNTDRPIYRPGQTVYFRGLLRGDDDGRYRLLPAGARVHIVGHDGLSHKTLDRYLAANAQGVVDGSLAVAPGAALGFYSLQATVGSDSVATSFQVAAYKKPTFKVTVLADRGENGNYVQGERVAAAVHADYYFGAPLPRASVIWNIASSTTSFQPTGYDDYSFIDGDLLNAQLSAPDNQQTSSSSGLTGRNGAATLSIPADLQGSQLPHSVTVEADVTAPTGDMVSQSTQVIVNPANVYVGLRPQNYLATPGSSQGIDVVTLHPDGSVAPHTAVQVALQRRRYFSVLRYDPQLGYMWQDRTRDRTVRTVEVTTDGAGRGTVHFTLSDTGAYRLAAVAADGHGRLGHGAAYVYSAAGDTGSYVDWGIANNDRIRVVADRRQYSIGQTAHILVSAPYPGMQALVTTERGTVLSHRVLTLRGNSPVIDVPITRDSLPNLYVSVVLFRGSAAGAAGALPIWKMGYTTLVVDPRERTLKVQLRTFTPASRVRPGARIRVAVHVTDGYGRPVAADLGVSLVDAAVLALAQNANGSATDAFYTQRPLGISTAASMSLFIDRLNLNPGSGTKGGGGGGAGPTPVRSRFPDTAYWNPNVLTDAAGNASLSFVLPDSLTTWRLAVDGSTAVNTLLGRGASDLISTKPVLVQPALPRFLAVRDAGRLGAVVSNTTGAPVRVTVSGIVSALDATGAVPAAGGTVQLAGQRVTVPAHADLPVYWTYIPAKEGLLSVTLSAAAADPSLSDALQVNLPVEQNSLLGAEAAATAGDATGATATERVRLPSSAEPGEGDLRLSLEPSLVSGLGGARDYLLAYPYDSMENMVSRLTGLLALNTLPARTFGLSPAAVAALPGQESSVTSQLYTAQNSDGGWGWWSGDQSDPYLSAYAYEGLIVLGESGYKVDHSILANAEGYLRGRLRASSGDPYAPDDAARAFIIYALGRAGSPDGAAAAALFDRRASLGAAARAELALGLSPAFGAGDARIRTLVRELSASARLTSVDAHWDAGSSPDAETMESSVGDTAMAVRALLAFDPRNPLIPRAVRWLMSQRGVTGNDGAWESTHATALALRALVSYARHTGDTHPTYGYRVLLNGAVVANGSVTPATAGLQRAVVVPLDALRLTGGGMVRIERTGAGLSHTPLHYTLRLRYYPAPGSVGAVDSGVSLTRRYLTHAGNQPLNGAAPRDATVTVELRLVAPQDLSRVIVQDPLPAGAEAVDGTLLTSSVFAQPGNSSGNGPSGPVPLFTVARPAPGQPQDLSPYVDHTELRDDRTTLFASHVPAGTYVYRYTVHLTTAGRYHVLPAFAYQTFQPEVFGHTALELFTITG